MFNSLIGQMDGAHFPVSIKDLPSRCRIITEDVAAFMRSYGFNVSRVATNHPGGAYGYRVENNGRAVVYLTDNELFPPDQESNYFAYFTRFCSGADILIHDAQYTEQDMPQKHGWGHSLVSQACRLAMEAGVKQLVLYHHDPDRTDDQLDEIQQSARDLIKKNNRSLICTVAYEGLTLSL